MMKRYLLPGLSLVGMAGALVVWLALEPKQKESEPVVTPAEAPFASYVSGSGLIESPTMNVEVATAVTEIVSRVEVKVGQRVKKGQVLFRLNDQTKRAEMERQRANIALARLRASKSEQGTRPEEIASQEARVAEARTGLEEARKQLALREGVGDARAVSRDELLQQQGNVRVKEEQLRYAERQLRLLQAGTWRPDVEIARADVVAAEMQLKQLEVELGRLTVLAPMDGEILQVNVHEGEMAVAGATEAPVVMGETRKFHVRAEVDENDAWRVETSAKAVAYPRGRKDVAIPLRLVRIEPLVGAKRNLTGESKERVDTRVLPVVYELDAAPIRLYVGQQMDVMIEAAPLPDPAERGRKRS